MSKRKYFGGLLDQVLLQPANRSPDYKVVIWNPNRTNIHEVVLDNAASPEYDITDWVQRIEYKENIVFENNEDTVASNVSLTIVYDQDAQPIEITGRTFLDGTPIRIFQGDRRVPKSKWVPIFTGICRGVPATSEESRDPARPKSIQVTAVDRAEKYLNKVVTARSYEKDTDVGKAAVETAIDWMYLDRREIRIGYQDYAIAHPQSQLVDIEVLSGIAQILFTVGKKPRFDSEGFLVAADTNLARSPVRNYINKDLIISVVRDQSLVSVYNSVRLLGIDDELSEVVEQDKRLAHGTITAGFYDSEVREVVYFSENDGKDNGGRRAKDTYLAKFEVSKIGDYVGENAEWVPKIEQDGYTVFEGVIVFDTGYDPTIRIVLQATYVGAIIAAGILRTLAVLDPISGAVLGGVAEGLELLAATTLVAILLSMTEIGRVYWEVNGKPFSNVYQQLCATAALDGILTEDLKELEVRNDWLYDTNYMRTRVQDLLKRELAKNWSYEITMVDDPLLEVDDIIQIEDKKYYISSIKKTIARPGSGEMVLSVWRIA